jgi:hypothetical protein
MVDILYAAMIYSIHCGILHPTEDFNFRDAGSPREGLTESRV